MKRELPAGAEKDASSEVLCFSDFEKLPLDNQYPIGIQGGNRCEKLEEFLELGEERRRTSRWHAPTRAKSFSSSLCKSIMVKSSQKQNRNKSLYPVSYRTRILQKDKCIT